MKEKCLNNYIRLAVATNCLKSKSLPPIKYPRDVVQYKYDSFLNQKFDFDLDEPIIYSRMKVEAKYNVLVLGNSYDIYDFVIAYLSNHEKGLLSAVVNECGHIEKDVFHALKNQSYFKSLKIKKFDESYVEIVSKELNKFLSNSKRKKVFIFNDSHDEESYREIIKYLDEHITGQIDVYMTDKFSYEKQNPKLKIRELDFMNDLGNMATDAISSVNTNKDIQINGDSHIIPEMKRLLMKKNVNVLDLNSEETANTDTILAYNNTFELLSKYLPLARKNKDSRIYVINDNFGELDLIRLFLPVEDQNQMYQLDIKMLWKTYFATHTI